MTLSPEDEPRFYACMQRVHGYLRDLLSMDQLFETSANTPHESHLNSHGQDVFDARLAAIKFVAIESHAWLRLLEDPLRTQPQQKDPCSVCPPHSQLFRLVWDTVLSYCDALLHAIPTPVPIGDSADAAALDRCFRGIWEHAARKTLESVGRSVLCLILSCIAYYLEPVLRDQVGDHSCRAFLVDLVRLVRDSQTYLTVWDTFGTFSQPTVVSGLCDVLRVALCERPSSVSGCDPSNGTAQPPDAVLWDTVVTEAYATLEYLIINCHCPILTEKTDTDNHLPWPPEDTFLLGRLYTDAVTQCLLMPDVDATVLSHLGSLWDTAAQLYDHRVLATAIPHVPFVSQTLDAFAATFAAAWYRCCSDSNDDGRRTSTASRIIDWFLVSHTPCPLLVELPSHTGWDPETILRCHLWRHITMRLASSSCSSRCDVHLDSLVLALLQLATHNAPSPSEAYREDLYFPSNRQQELIYVVLPAVVSRAPAALRTRVRDLLIRQLRRSHEIASRPRTFRDHPPCSNVRNPLGQEIMSAFPPCCVSLLEWDAALFEGVPMPVLMHVCRGLLPLINDEGMASALLATLQSQLDEVERAQKSQTEHVFPPESAELLQNHHQVGFSPLVKQVTDTLATLECLCPSGVRVPPAIATRVLDFFDHYLVSTKTPLLDAAAPILPRLLLTSVLVVAQLERNMAVYGTPIQKSIRGLRLRSSLLTTDLLERTAHCSACRTISLSVLSGIFIMMALTPKTLKQPPTFLEPLAVAIAQLDKNIHDAPLLQLLTTTMTSDTICSKLSHLAQFLVSSSYRDHVGDR